MEVRFHGRGGQGVVTAAARPMVRPAEDERVTRLHATAEHPDLETLTHSREGAGPQDDLRGSEPWPPHRAIGKHGGQVEVRLVASWSLHHLMTVGGRLSRCLISQCLDPDDIGP